jgi:HlyD family secretion protein
MTKDTKDAPALRSSLRAHVGLVTLFAVLLVIVVGGWATMTEFSGAVIAPGQVVVDSNVKRVQHPTGGVIGELHVRDGRQVRAGDILIRLDDVQTRANFAIVSKALDELTARQARLEAERDDDPKVTFPRDLLDRADNPDVARSAQGAHCSTSRGNYRFERAACFEGWPDRVDWQGTRRRP